MNLREIEKRHRALLQESQAINDRTEGRGLTAEEQRTWDDNAQEMERLSRQADLERKRYRAAGVDLSDGPISAGNGHRADDRPRFVDSRTGRELRSYLPGEPITRPYALPDNAAPEEFSLGHYIRGLVTGEWREQERELRIMIGGDPTAGGYLLPTVLSDRVVGLLRQASVFTRAGAISLEMESPNMEDFQRKMAELKKELAVEGGRFDAVYCCPHSSEDRCECRKPLPGMLLKARVDLDIDLHRSYVVGDAGAWDMALARRVGSQAVLVRTGLGVSSLDEYRHTWSDIEPDHIAEDVLEAVQWIIAQETSSEQTARGDA
jgi:HAD superfamily hydrolase (TIGR01662 family)